MSMPAATGARARLLLRNASQIVTIGGGSLPKVGEAMNSVEVLTDHSLLVDSNGVIASIVPSGAPTEALERSLAASAAAAAASSSHGGGNPQQQQPHHHAVADHVVDCAGKCVLPGFVDAHTHAIFDGDRSHEHALKLAGATYEQVHASGGGINRTVTATRAASEARLLELLLGRFDDMMRCGTTTCEVKSGYGLDWDTEVKMLRVLQAAKSCHPMGVRGTFLVHAVPQGTTSARVAEQVVRHQLPALADLVKTSQVCAEFVDVFCEKGFFSREESRAILQAGQAAGFEASFHGDELNDLQCGELAAEIGARGVSHLEMLSNSGVEAMAKAQVHAVLLPTTAYLLRLPTPPAKALVGAGAPVCVATDFNPNAHCFDMPTALNHACVGFGLSMEQALVAGTQNGASALGVADKVGSLEVGKLGDCLVLDAPSWEHVIYQFRPPISHVFKEGRPAPFSPSSSSSWSSTHASSVSSSSSSSTAAAAGASFTAPLSSLASSPSSSSERPKPTSAQPSGHNTNPSLSVLSRGIPLDPLPPPVHPSSSSTSGTTTSSASSAAAKVPRAPKRPLGALLTKELAAQALANALRYFPPHTHAELAPEFAAELREWGHVYMHRFRPTEYAMRAYPLDQYPAKSVHAAALMHMVMNNLDPAVAQFPHELVTYGGNGSAFSNWAQYLLTMQHLSAMTDSHTLCLHSGHPMGLFPSHPDAPRLVVTNGMVVPNYSSRADYERLFCLGVSQYGQMTAGSFCYIGPQGIVHGTTLTLLNAGRKFLGLGAGQGGATKAEESEATTTTTTTSTRSASNASNGGNGGGSSKLLQGKLFVTSGLGGMSGAQAKAAVICGAVALVAEVDGSAVEKRFRQGWVLERSASLDECLALARAALAQGRATSIAYHGNVVDVWERLAADRVQHHHNQQQQQQQQQQQHEEGAGEGGPVLLSPHLGSDQTSCHNPFGGGYYPVGLGFEEAKNLMAEDPDRFKELVQASLRRQVAAINTLTAPAPAPAAGASGSSPASSAASTSASAASSSSASPMHFFDYGNSFLLEASRAGADVLDKSKHSDDGAAAGGGGGGGGGGEGEKNKMPTFRYPSYVEAIMGNIFSLGFGPFRWVCTSASPEDLRATDAIALRVLADLKQRYSSSSSSSSSTADSSSFSSSSSPSSSSSSSLSYAERALPQLEDNMLWIQEAEGHELVVGSQARILYANADARIAIALAMNAAVRAGALHAPVVLSRDHHDVSGTDSPWRETANVTDGSKFCADMAVHNAIGDACRGATSVSLHNGGGTGWGEAVNGGFLLVLDGTEDAARRARMMLHWDVFNGVTRRAWAGNEGAVAYAAHEQLQGQRQGLGQGQLEASLVTQLPHRASEQVLEKAVAVVFEDRGEPGPLAK